MVRTTNLKRGIASAALAVILSGQLAVQKLQASPEPQPTPPGPGRLGCGLGKLDLGKGCKRVSKANCATFVASKASDFKFQNLEYTERVCGRSRVRTSTGVCRSTSQVERDILKSQCAKVDFQNP
jgi:hypothetical protein